MRDVRMVNRSGCWQGTSRKKLYEEPGWEPLTEKKYVYCLTMFYKIRNGRALPFLSDHIPEDLEIETQELHFLELRDKSIVCFHVVLLTGTLTNE